MLEKFISQVNHNLDWDQNFVNKLVSRLKIIGTPLYAGVIGPNKVLIVSACYNDILFSKRTLLELEILMKENESEAN